MTIAPDRRTRRADARPSAAPPRGKAADEIVDSLMRDVVTRVEPALLPL